MDPSLCDGVDSQYLAKVLGHALQMALVEICQVRPYDPIQYLALWLKKHSLNVQHQQEVRPWILIDFSNINMSGNYT